MPAADRPLPSPRRPTFAQNGDARGHTVPPFPFAQKRCAQGHTAHLLPSPFPLVRATPVRAERGMRGQHPIPWRPVRTGRSARGQAIPASLSRSRAATAQRQARRRDTPPPLPARARKRGDSAPTMSLGAGNASPAPRRPRTQGEGRRAHPVPSAGNASPATRTPHRTARARKGRRRHPTPPHGLFRPCLRAPPYPRTQEGQCAQPSRFCAGCTSRFAPGRRRVRGGRMQARTHAKGHRTRDGTTRGGEQRGRSKGVRARRGAARCGATRVPGGAACERRGVRIGADVRKGEGDGGGVVNGAKRSRGKAARANSGTPCQ
ncbi:hypothetical protein EDB85DRAFT_1897317 [Lactarius pseudohatsudake]|nr:hypothetical protein EDB85DRAFT_1897317 [Lactarius pseudohatsudake]